MTDSSRANYSRLDRALHKLAFSNLEIQKSLADIEDRMHAKRLEPIAIEKPVFITALPRAGTTLMLDVLARNPGTFATHTYRCMPFVLCPVLWDSISRGFRRADEKRERMHGDGMNVGYDSPEAFEEVLWRAFWPQKYHADRIELWSSGDRNAEFEDFLRNHIRKLIALLAPVDAKSRYISKNNANIARLPLLRAIFPDAIFITPFRDPINQAASLLRQHIRFLKIHADDPFARLYMDYIGHFEFGSGLRPIDFPSRVDARQPVDPMTGDFWLAYWIRGYSFLASGDSPHFIDFDKFCAEPARSLAALGRQLECEDHIAQLRSAAGEFHAAVSYDEAKLSFDGRLVADARALHEHLSSRALNRDFRVRPPLPQSSVA
jgi:hypothetical protein